MPKIMQNLVVLMEPSDVAWDISLKYAMMCLNRFCIDEDSAFEVTGVFRLKIMPSESKEFVPVEDQKQKGTGYFL